MRSVRLRHLEVFVAVAGSGSMQRATELVHLTQPAISKIVTELERTFAVRLIERSGRGIKLTACGTALAHRARAILNDMSTASEEMAAIERGTIGRVRVGALPVAEAVIIPRTLLRLRSSAPSLTIQIEEGTRPVLLNALRRGEIDCVIGRLDRADEHGFHVEKLMALPVSVVASRKHRLARMKRLSWRDLAGYPWVMPHEQAPIRAVIENEFIRFGIQPPTPVIESTSSRLNQVIVAQTDMIAVMTQDAAAAYTKNHMLAILPIKIVGPLPQVGVITRTGYKARAVETFLSALRAQCAELNVSRQKAS